MDYPESMAECENYISVYWDSEASCQDCGGTGLVPVMCCSGRMCGCYGKPVDFEDCGCGIQPTQAKTADSTNGGEV